MRGLFVAVLLALACLLPGAGPALAYPSEQEIIQRANDETGGHFSETNKAGRPLALRQIERGQVQGPIWRMVDRIAPGLPLYVLTWGDPHNEPGESDRDGQPRYLGYTYWNEDFTNPAFPHDAWAGGKLEDRNWIEEPWYYAPGQQPNDYDGKAEYREAVALGLKLYYGDVVYGPKLRPEFWGSLEKYVHVLAPPSYYTWGMGRMWHRLADGSVWYLSVPIAPTGMLLDADLAVRIEPAEVTARPGDEVTFTAYLKLKKAPAYSDFFAGYQAASEGSWYADGVGAWHVTNDFYSAALEPQAGSPALDEWGSTAGWMEEGREYGYAVKVHAQEASSEVWVMGFPGLPSMDADLSDNLAVAKINVEKINLAVRNLTLDPNSCSPGDAVTARAEIVNEGSQDVTTVARWIFEGQVVAEQEVWIPAGGYNVTQAQISAPDEPGTYAVGILANPNHDRPPNEKTYDDNYAEGYLEVRQLASPGSDGLTLQAWSHPGTDLYGEWQPARERPVNTAKWSDDVKATLRVARPVPPRGKLDWWEISSAKLTYPRQNPDFTFGCPYPPSGTVTVNMKLPGRAGPETDWLEAAAEFEENWAMDGFPVYCMLEERQMTTEKPKSYPVTAAYTVRYQYTYWVGFPPEPVTVEASYTRTARQDLLVNGAGTIPYGS